LLQPTPEDQKGGDMKKQAFTVFALLALTAVLGVGSGYAQCISGEARIPFDFKVSGMTLPAGTYSLQPVAEQACLIQKDDGSKAVITLVRTTGEMKDQGSKWVFHRYGQRYFLAKIVADGTTTELPVSKLEREMARLGTNREYAYVPALQH
jgi:hypothetical protein